MKHEFHCPSPTEVLAAVLALLPRGRAWQTHEAGPQPGTEPAFDVEAFENEAFSTASLRPSIIRQYWAAVAAVFTFVNQRLCDLRLEFWCATHSETHAEWMQEYGLPDACDPFPDLCTKVAAIGGTRCEYYSDIAARAGWAISCRDAAAFCGVRSGARRAKAGMAKPGRVRSGFLIIVVDLKNSRSFTGSAHIRPKAGRLKAGRRLACGPDIGPLECLLARVVHAELQVKYEVIL